MGLADWRFSAAFDRFSTREQGILSLTQVTAVSILRPQTKWPFQSYSGLSTTKLRASHATRKKLTMSIGDGSDIDFATMRGRDYPCIRQFTVFMENRVGQLLDVVRRFEGSKVRIVALSIMDSFECACVRFLLSHPEQGREILERAGLALIETDLIGIELPTGNQPLLRVCTALLQAEVNIVQAYPLLMRPNEQPVVAVLVDNIEMAMDTLASKKFRMITEDDLADFD